MASSVFLKLDRNIAHYLTAALFSMFEAAVLALAPVHAQVSSSAEKVPIPQAYWDAVEDARVPEPQEIFRNLTAITPFNRELSWDGTGRVLVATWTTWRGYDQSVGSQLILSRDIWVTAVPDLQNFCKKYIPTTEIPLAARLNQLLGLPPENADRANSRRVVEFWVDPRFLFRPSPDPEITDREAELSFRPWSEFMFVSLSYRNWFYTQYDQRYQHQDGRRGQLLTPDTVELPNVLPYPWTQLGYTYDWGDPSDWDTVDSSRPDEVGLSEFVIRTQSPVLVYSSQHGASYCRAN